MSQPVRKRGGLGRGLGALIPTGPSDMGPRMGDAAADVVLGGAPTADVTPAGAVYREITPSDIEPNPRQPRQVFDDEALSGRKQIRPLDLAREKQRYGAETRGGIGVSVAPA